MPFYTGNLDYCFTFEVAEAGKYVVQVPDFSAPLLAVFLDGEKKGLIAFAPHSLELGQLSAGAHQLTIRMFGNRHNRFGYLHNCNENYVWYGPSAYRTTDNEWTDYYLMRKAGVFSPVIVKRC